MRGRLLGTAVALLVVAIAMSGGPNPASGQAKPGAKKIDLAHITPPPESRAVAQTKVREMTESVDNFQKAKEILEAKGMKVNQSDVASFRKIAEEKIWPPYRQQYADMWDKIVNTR